MNLDEKSLIHEACKIAGTTDLGSEDYLPALRALLAAYKSDVGAAETEAGVQLLATLFTQHLVNRARIIDALKAHPEALDIPIERPIFIASLPRTGTTVLHQMLWRDPANRAPLLWELLCPVDPPGVDPQHAAEAQIAQTGGFLEMFKQAVPGFLEKIHPLDPAWPDECEWLFRNSFATVTLAAQFQLPSFAKWLVEQDMLPAYRFYKQQLQLILWRNPGKNLVLKDPAHILNLETLFEVFPDALVIQTHRDPVETVGSSCSLFYAASSFCRGAYDPKLSTGFSLWLLDRMVAKTFEYRSKHGSSRIIDVQYSDIVSKPVETVKRIYELAGRPFNEGAQDAIKSWLAENPQHKGGKHAYSLEQFGLDAGEIRRRYQPYTERFVSGS